MEMEEVKYNICKTEFERIEAVYNRDLDRINIALLVSNAAIGFIFLAPEDASLEALISSARSQLLLIWSLVLLFVAVVLLLFLSWQRLRAPFSVERFDRVSDSGGGADDYFKLQTRLYLAWFRKYERKLYWRRWILGTALTLTVIGIMAYLLARVVAL